MRTVSETKPHIFKGAFHWVCCMTGRRLGFGANPKQAYREWVRLNQL